jgi:hypothetical protein
MKKLAALLVLGGIFVFAVTSAQARKEWAYYKQHYVAEKVVCGGYCGDRTVSEVWVHYDSAVPPKYKEDPDAACECVAGEYETEDVFCESGAATCDERTIPEGDPNNECVAHSFYYLDCTACHGPDAPGNHDGPQNLRW